LKGTKYTEDAVRNTLSKFNIENYFSSISLEQILKLMF
ncbi:MAG TPA: lipoate--protein ligase, partial [Clostridiaceae bacterium]|nr:lipoate--protein ligase [Clostridiaceae bacterium]